jgi:hypothetical protein
MESAIKKKMAVIIAGIFVVAAAALVLLIVAAAVPRPNDYGNKNILNLLDDSNRRFWDGNVLTLAEGKSTGSITANTSLPTTYLAFVRTTFKNQEELFNLYKPYLLAGDYVSTISISPPNPAQNLDQLPFSSDKIKGVTYFSLDEIKNNIQSLKQRGIGFIGYDLENEGSPASDRSNPVSSMREAYNTAHQHGLKFLAVPGYPFNTNAYISQFAHFADLYVIQAQGNESKPSIYQSSVKSRIDTLKAVNPEIRIITELSTNKGTVSDMQKSFSMVAHYVDGVTMWQGSVKDLPKVKQFLEWYNQNYRQ